jgi:hypothetical protein
MASSLKDGAIYLNLATFSNIYRAIQRIHNLSNIWFHVMFAENGKKIVFALRLIKSMI